jgi:hypothetical protein
LPVTQDPGVVTPERSNVTPGTYRPYRRRSALGVGSAPRFEPCCPFPSGWLCHADRLEQHSWETEGGDRRTKVEILADDIGASLRSPRPRSREPRHNGAHDPVDEVVTA